MSSSALPFFNSRSRIGEAIYNIAIYDLNESPRDFCLNFFLLSFRACRGIPRKARDDNSCWLERRLSGAVNRLGYRISAETAIERRRSSNYSVRNAVIGLIRVA